MKRAAYVVMVFALLVASLLPTNHPVNAASFQVLHFSTDKQFTIKCSVGLECSVSLEPGEEYGDAFNAQASAWDPHMAYEGGGKLQKPVLILRPGPKAARTNVVLTTTRRTYFLELVPIQATEPLYYNFHYDDTTYRDLNGIAIATQQAIRDQGGLTRGASPQPLATPADVADLQAVCTDYDYTYIIARYLPDDHAHTAKPSSDAYPGTWKPQVVCNDGQHTYIQVPHSAQAPTDLPVVLAITSEGDTLLNKTFNAARWRFTINGVYDKFVLELGSQNRPLRLVIAHHNKDGVVPEQQGRHATPIPIPRPVAAAAAAPPSATRPTPSSAAFMAPTPAIKSLPQLSAAKLPDPLSSPTPGSNEPRATAISVKASAAPNVLPSTVVVDKSSPTPSPSPTSSPARVASPTPAPSATPSILRVGASPSGSDALRPTHRAVVTHSANWEFGGGHLMWPTRYTHTAPPAKRASAVDVKHKPFPLQPTPAPGAGKP